MIQRGAEEEAAAPKYAVIERERRFLVDPRRRPDLSSAPSVLIEDRYIDGARLRLRRMTDSVTGRVVLKLGKKYESADPLARPVVTTYLTDGEYALLIELPARALVKRAFDVGGFRLDMFEGALAGLELAEFDAGTATALATATVPDWVKLEVSADARFDGANLAALDAADLHALLVT